VVILDTNVLSELMKSSPHAGVLAWVDIRPSAELFVASVTQAELLYGIALLPVGERHSNLARALDVAFARLFRDRILRFDSLAASAFADIAAERRRAGRPIGCFDAQIAAIARWRRADLAIRNIMDFEGCGLELVNPWEES
jgi:toxin FitB